MTADDRAHDIVLFGATGFVGRLVARYLAEHAPAGTRIAIAGRSRGRLLAVRNELGGRAAEWPLIVADSQDSAAMRALAGETRVVATTVGPYAKYGMPLLGACASAGTHYADLTGEVLFIRESIDRFDQEAQRNGARLVHACGFDSIPSDLGVLMVHQRARADGAGDLGETVLAATLRGGLSGGTIDSMRTQVNAMRADPAKQKIVHDPYSLSPDRRAEPDAGADADGVSPRREPMVHGWAAPFVMSPFNSRIVRRSNALQDWAYGRSFRYREVMAFGAGPLGAAAAAAVAGGQAGLALAMASPARRVLDRVLPKPGSGPSETVRARGHFRMDLHADTAERARYHGVVAARGDPGYAATAVMFGESALCLADDAGTAGTAGALPDRAGVLTPATAMGGVLLDRLRAAGFQATVERT